MAALRRPVLVATTCLACGRPLAVCADPERPPAESYVVQVLVPAACWWDDVVAACSTIRMACDPLHVQAWAAGQGTEPGAVVDLVTMWRLAGVWYSDRLRDDYRRPTPREANALFAGLGLTGPFWTLPAAPTDEGAGR